MVQKKKSEIAKEETKKMLALAEINEAYLVGLLWTEPDKLYGEYSKKIDSSMFLHKVWGFYYGLGKNLYESGAKVYDDIIVHSKTKELNVFDMFEEFGGMSTIEEAVMIVNGEDNGDNVGYYYESVRKNKTVVSLYKLFGDKVLVPTARYDYSKMTKEQLMLYWTDQINTIEVDGISDYETENLFINADDFLEKIKESSANMMKFYDSYLMNTITQGVPRGSVFMFGGFGNTGKTSIMSEKFVMACLESGEKSIIILNEEDAQSFRQKIMLSILNHHLHTRVDRKKLVNGSITLKDEQLIRQAFDKWNDIANGEDGQIKVVYMKSYNIIDLEAIIKQWANRGYVNLLIDTHKVSESGRYNQRWESFVEDTKKIHALTRAEAGGYNLRTILTFQLADSHLHDRFLGFDAIGEGKAAKNEAAIVMMYRPIFGDEYDSLFVYKNINEGTKESPIFVKEKITLDKTKTYYLLFCPKNRYGANTDNGQPILVLQPEFDFNAFYEVGWTHVERKYN